MTDPTCPTCEAPFYTNAVICPACRNRVERCLVETGSLLRDLDVTLTKQSKMRANQASTELDPTPTVFHVGASNAGENYRRVLMSWAALVRDSIGHYVPVLDAAGKPDRFPDGELITRFVTDAPYTGGLNPVNVAQYLAHHLEWLTRHEAAPDFYTEILAASHRVEHVIDLDPGRFIIGVCGSEQESGPCGEVLWAREGSTVVQCRVCGTMWDVRERRLDSYMKAVNTVADGPTITRAFTHDGIALTTHRINVWVSRDLLAPVTPRRYVVAHVARLIRMSAAGEKLSAWTEKETAL